MKNKKINSLTYNEVICKIVELNREHGQTDALHVKHLRARAKKLMPKIVKCY